MEEQEQKGLERGPVTRSFGKQDLLPRTSKQSSTPPLTAHSESPLPLFSKLSLRRRRAEKQWGKVDDSSESQTSESITEEF